MPEEIEVPLEHAQEHIEEAHRERHGEAREGKEAGEGKEKEHDGWTRFIAVVTALLAVVAAIGALQSGLLVNEALLAKNDQVGHLTQASDTVELLPGRRAEGADLQNVRPGPAARLARCQGKLRQSAHYKASRTTLQQSAKELEDEGGGERARVRRREMDKHHIFAFSVSLCQIAIALSAVAALTRNRRVWYFGLAAGLLGIAALLGGFLGVRLPFGF